MTRAGIAAVRSSTAQLVESIPQVDDEQGELPSSCGGRRAIDGVAHLAALTSEAVDPPPPALPCRRTASGTRTCASTNAVAGAMRKSSTSGGAATPGNWSSWKRPRNRPGRRGRRMPGLGTYPRHLLANTMAFNVFCHVRHNMLARTARSRSPCRNRPTARSPPPSTSCSPVSPRCRDPN
jgi:hypothetical protein